MSLKPDQDVGPFRLAEKIGLGGMGEVWKAHHHAHHTPVAIKVVTSDEAARDRYRAVFLREVQAVAALNHPGVVAVHDYGAIDISRREKLPWYAMELAKTSLADVVVHDWPTLHRILVEILDALAHAHARGVIHRDLKPENVLLTEDYAVRLTDFGMAHIAETTVNTGNVFGPGGGTPDFMSPEQFRGEWRKFGPWTDLYALGCLAWEVATGVPPFPGKAVVDIAMLHMSEAPPRLAPLFPVPRRFELWLKQLLQKHPLDRFRRAADAQWALVHDVGSVPGAAAAALPSRPGSGTNARLPTLDSWEQRPPRQPDTLEEIPLKTLEATYSLTPPFPDDWRTHYELPRIGGAGLGLFGIREVPYIGRVEERELVWEKLREVDANEQNQVVLVHGEPGTGRSRFGQWIARRADELGAATVVRANHNPIASRRDGIAGATTRLLGIEGVDASRARDIVTDRLGLGFDSRPLLDLLYRTTDEASAGTSTFVAPNQRFATVERLFRHLALERTVIFFVDDVQWGADSLLFIQHLLASRTRTLVIATVRGDTLLDRFWESQLLTEINQSEHVTSVTLEPLDGKERLGLIRSMLDIEAPLARKVAARSQGIPLFAVQLVGDWVQRDLLVEGPRGFRLRDKGAVDLPDDVYALWNQRISELEASLREPRVREMLEVAALLGRGDEHEWPRVCAGLGLHIPATLIEELVSRRLAARDEEGWAFQHGMLREALERSAVESGRDGAIYTACADFADASDPYRKAEFEVRAGRFNAAIDSLLEALRIGILSVAVDQSLQLVELIEDLFREVTALADDRRRGVLGEARVTLLRLGGRLEEARTRAKVLAKDATKWRWGRVAGDANIHLGSLSQGFDAPTSEILHYFDEALVIFDELDDDRGRARAYRALAHYHVCNNRPYVASSLTSKALAILQRIGDEEGIVECEVAMGGAELAAGRVSEAESWFRRARDHAARAGYRHYEALSFHGLGTVSRKHGALETAERKFRSALDLWRGIGSPEADTAALGLSLVHFDRYELERAADVLDTLAGRLDDDTNSPNGLLFCAAMLAVSANRGDRETFDRCRDRIARVQRRARDRDSDVGQLAFIAGDIWSRRSDKARARLAYDIARNQFLALGERQRADDVALAIGRLGAVR